MATNINQQNNNLQTKIRKITNDLKNKLFDILPHRPKIVRQNMECS